VGSKLDIEDRDPRFIALMDLGDRFEMVLEAVEEDEGWATNRVAPER